MVTKYGMSERIGLATFGEHTPLFLKGTGMGGEREYSDETARTIDAEIRSHPRPYPRSGPRHADDEEGHPDLGGSAS